jgi:tetratricopeptide (TPR) repeat protein
MTFEIPADFISLDDSNNLYKKITAPASTVTPLIRKGATVKVHYTGSLYPSGEVFDSSLDRGDPLSFKIGQGQVIKGWDVGIASMSIGEKAELLILSEYGYGASGSPPKIPANATLLFKVELVNVDESTAEMSIEEKVQSATELKNQGNQCYKSGGHREATDHYKKALELISSTWGAEPDQAALIKDLKVSLNSNASMCFILIGEADKVVQHAQAVLDIEPEHEKALYRLSQGLSMQGKFEDAIHLLQTKKDVLKGVHVDQEVLKIKKVKQKQLQNEKQMYSKMFG